MHLFYGVIHETFSHLCVVEVCTGRIFQSRPGLARPGPHGYNLGPTQPEVKKKISAQARPGPKEKLKLRPEPGPARKGI